MVQIYWLNSHLINRCNWGVNSQLRIWIQFIEFSIQWFNKDYFQAGKICSVELFSKCRKLAIKFFIIKLYRIYRIWRIPFLLILKIQLLKVVCYKFHRFCRICRILLVVILKRKITKHSILQILQILCIIHFGRTRMLALKTTVGDRKRK